MEKECMNCGGSIYFQCRKEAAKYNDRLSSREGASEISNQIDSGKFYFDKLY